MTKIFAFLKDESGASAAEYALILGVVCVALFGAVTLLSGAISGAISGIATDI